VIFTASAQPTNKRFTSPEELLTVTIENGKITSFRARVRLAFEYDIKAK